jgi:hypothetical protein
MKIIDDKVLFETTDREVCANRGIIGIDPNGSIYDGYDGYLDWELADMTAEERKELSEHMILAWVRFGNK